MQPPLPHWRVLVEAKMLHSPEKSWELCLEETPASKKQKKKKKKKKKNFAGFVKGLLPLRSQRIAPLTEIFDPRTVVCMDALKPVGCYF